MNPKNISLSVIETKDGQIFYDFVPIYMISSLFISRYRSLPDHIICSFNTELHDLILLSSCTLTIESDRPEWFDESRYNHLYTLLRDYMSSLIVYEDTSLLVGQYAIICSRARIQKAYGCHILGMFDFSEIEQIERCEVWNICDNSKIFNSFESSIYYMHNFSHIVFSKNNTRIYLMKDCTSIHDAQLNTYIEHMTDISHVDRLSYNSFIQEMYKDSYVDEATYKSSINLMDDNSYVNIMTDTSMVRFMKGRSKVLSMYHDTLVVNKEASCDVSSMHHNAKVLNII